MIKHVQMDKLAGTTLGTYHLERFIGQSKIGPTFLARNDTTTTYLLRFLDGPMYTTLKEHEVYLEHFQYRASQIATLQHPYILPCLTLESSVASRTWSRHTSHYDHYVLVLKKMVH